MDRNDAIRIVIFEYLLPMQRDTRVKIIQKSFKKENVTVDWVPEIHPAGIFEEIHRLSEQLLYSQFFATSYIYPLTMQHEDSQLDERKNVCALVDNEGPFVWDTSCPRKSDPIGGIRVFKASNYMSSGRFFVYR